MHVAWADWPSTGKATNMQGLPATIWAMSLAVVFKGPEGIVLAADSRVTLTAQVSPTMSAPSYFDNATKLLEIPSQSHCGVVTYGQGVIGQREPRTAHSFMPEFDAHLSGAPGGKERLPVERTATELGRFFLDAWVAASMPEAADPMVFLVAGFDEGEAYGCVYEVVVPSQISPILKHDPGTFGITWGGQHEIVNRIITGFDPRALEIIRSEGDLGEDQIKEIHVKLQEKLRLPIPYQFLPLQDCVDLSRYIVKLTATVQTWIVGVRGVGGAIDVATITRTDGFRALERKVLSAGDV